MSLSLDIKVCFAKLRAGYPIQIRLYVVMDNLSAHIRAATISSPRLSLSSRAQSPTPKHWRRSRTRYALDTWNGT